MGAHFRPAQGRWAVERAEIEFSGSARSDEARAALHSCGFRFRSRRSYGNLYIPATHPSISAKAGWRLNSPAPFPKRAPALWLQLPGACPEARYYGELAWEGAANKLGSALKMPPTTSETPFDNAPTANFRSPIGMTHRSIAWRRAVSGRLLSYDQFTLLVRALRASPFSTKVAGVEIRAEGVVLWRSGLEWESNSPRSRGATESSAPHDRYRCARVEVISRGCARTDGMDRSFSRR